MLYPPLRQAQWDLQYFYLDVAVVAMCVRGVSVFLIQAIPNLAILLITERGFS